MNFKKTTIYLLLSLYFIQISAQDQAAKAENKAPKESSMQNASKGYENMAYVDAIKTYERIANKGYKSIELFQNLGNSYFFNAQLPEAYRWYKELFTLNEMENKPALDAEYYYRYANTLKAVGDYKNADKYMEQFNALSKDDVRAVLFEKNKNYLTVIKSNSGRYKIQDAGINSKYSDFGVAILDDKIIFASSRETDRINQNKAQWNGQSFTNLYSAQLSEDGTAGAPTLFTKTLNSKFNECTPIFTSDGKTMYFTRNDYTNGKKGKDAANTTKLKIYKATFENDEWGGEVELPFNSSQYSVAHPALSVDEKTLYFASDMPGTIGLSDLFKVRINSDGTYGNPVNLGTKINTPGKETFPFIADNNELYFSTDGHPGLGGLDVFVTKINQDNTFEEPTNVGGPINDRTDDFGFIFNSKTKTGYFTSNREGNYGFDDIYKFTEKRPLTCQQILAGAVTDETTGDYLANAQLILTDSKFKELKQIFADENGKYTFEVECGQNYYLKVSKPGYEVNENKVSILKETGKTNSNIKLVKKSNPVKVGDNLASFLKIKMIYFDLSKATVRTDAALELEKILDVMVQNPTLKIDVRSHTDSRASTKFNADLSERRARATIEWLIKNGISPQRLTGKGYGESRLVNNCGDGVECSEEDHQANRRSEFIVLSI